MVVASPLLALLVTTKVKEKRKEMMSGLEEVLEVVNDLSNIKVSNIY